MLKKKPATYAKKHPDAQLQATISGFDHTLGSVETIGEGKNSQDLKQAINDGVRIIVTTLQEFPVIYEEVDAANGRNYAVICDEAHSSQIGSSAQKLKTALADLRDALKEYAEIEGIAEDKVDPQDKLVKELIAHGKHKNLSFFAFTLGQGTVPWDSGTGDGSLSSGGRFLVFRNMGHGQGQFLIFSNETG